MDILAEAAGVAEHRTRPVVVRVLPMLQVMVEAVVVAHLMRPVVEAAEPRRILHSIPHLLAQQPFISRPRLPIPR